MPYQEPDPTDPNILVGIVLPADRDATLEMAYVFAEEFARMGYKKEQILGLFKTPFYAGAYGAYLALGDKAIQSLIEECANAWGSVQFSLEEGSCTIQSSQSKMEEGKSGDG